MLKLDVSKHYFYPVTVDLIDEEGHSQPHQFEARFFRFGQKEVESMLAEAERGELNDSELIEKVLTGWRDVFGDDGTPLQFRHDTKAQLLDVVPVRSAIVAAWIDSITAGAAKNFLRSPASGLAA